MAPSSAKGTKVHLTVDTLGHLLALHTTPAYVDQGYTGAAPRQAAADHSIQLAVVKLPHAKRGFVLLPRR